MAKPLKIINKSGGSKEDLIRISNESPVIMMRWKNAPGWPVEFVSENISQWGYSPHDFTSGKLDYESIVHPDDVEKMSGEAVKLLQNRLTQYKQTYRVLKANGDILWIDDRTWVEYDTEGKPVMINGVLIDMTDRINAEIAYRDKNERLKIAVAASNIGFYDYRVETGDVFYSREWKTQLGFDESELENHYETWFNLLHPDDRERAVATLRDFSTDPSAFLYKSKFRLARKKDGYSWILANGIAERDAEGNLRKLVGSHIDITDRVEQEMALKKALEEKNILLSEVHHRIKNNLAVISGILQLQLDYLDTAKERSIFLETISKVRSISLIHEALYQNTSISDISVHEYLPRVVQTIQDSFSNKEKLIRIYIDIDELNIAIEKAIPLGLLVNEVITNAFKHAFHQVSEGKIHITLKVNPSKSILEIRDNGEGIPTSSSSKNSTSIGMNIIEGLAAQLGGTLRMYNDGGAVTELELPVN